MKTAYLTINQSCYKVSNDNETDETNVQNLKDYLNNYSNVSNAKTY